LYRLGTDRELRPESGVPAVGGHTDQILDAQVKQAIDAQMAAKGFAKSDDPSKADLLLNKPSHKCLNKIRQQAR